MYTHADKTRDSKSQSFGNDIAHKQNSGEPAFQFANNRPEAIAQRKLQEKRINNSSQVKQAAQLQSMADNNSAERQLVQKKENKTGLPDNLKAGIENLSGYSMDDVKVHYNSDKPEQIQAHAYAQGTDIHLASGQEKHLPHEAWHVVQQKQGRVKPTVQVKGKVNVNDDSGLEKEADIMGQKAMQGANGPYYDLLSEYATHQIVQRHTRRSRRNRPKKRKNKRNTSQDTSGGFSYLEHYSHKLPHLFDLLTSFRRQRMLITSTLTREYLHRFSQGSLSHVPTSEITLLHPNSLEDTKTKKRYDIILKYLSESSGKIALSNQEITHMIPSDEGIQVAKVADNRYVSMQGVGRIVAIKEAVKTAKRNVTIEIMTYDLSDMPVIPGQLEAISASYDIDEGLISKTFGTLLGIGLPAFIFNYLSGGKLVQMASWMASFVVNKMEHDLTQSESGTYDPFEYQYPEGTRTDG